MPWLQNHPMTAVPAGHGAPCVWGPMGPEFVGFAGMGALGRPGSRSMGNGYLGGPFTGGSAC